MRSADAHEPAVPKGYFPALDGLRLICCAWVVVGHSFRDHPWEARASALASMGVNVFFALSGFLITTILLSERQAHGRVDFRAFYVRRALRIFPVYYAAVALTFGLLALFGDRFLRPFAATRAEMEPGLAALAYATFTANWTALRVPSSIDVLWSVCVEEQFYLVAPWLFTLRGGRWPALGPILVGFVVAWITRGVLAAHAPSWIYRNPVSHADHLLAGALLAQLVHASGGDALRRLARAGTAGELLVFAGLLGMVEWQSRTSHGVAGWVLDYMLSSVLSALLVGLVAARAGALSALFERRVVRSLGQRTYAGYVFHMFAVAVAWWLVARVTRDPWLGAPLRTALALPLTFALAHAVWISFERRVLVLKDRFQPAPAA